MKRESGNLVSLVAPVLPSEVQLPHCEQGHRTGDGQGVPTVSFKAQAHFQSILSAEEQKVLCMVRKISDRHKWLEMLQVHHASHRKSSENVPQSYSHRYLEYPSGG